MSQHFFSGEALKQIEQAVKEAEATSAGEIVPVFARHSSFYEMALWRGGFLVAVVVSLVLLIVDATTEALIFLPSYVWLLAVFFFRHLWRRRRYAVCGFEAVDHWQEISQNQGRRPGAKYLLPIPCFVYRTAVRHFIVHQLL